MSLSKCGNECVVFLHCNECRGNVSRLTWDGSKGSTIRCRRPPQRNYVEPHLDSLTMADSSPLRYFRRDRASPGSGVEHEAHRSANRVSGSISTLSGLNTRSVNLISFHGWLYSKALWEASLVKCKAACCAVATVFIASA